MDWSHVEISDLAASVARTPAVPGPRPWVLRFAENAVELHERLGFSDTHPAARDRLVSCGAAAATLELTLRHRGLRTRLELMPNPARPRLLARADSTGIEEPTAREAALYAAIAHRHSHREPFSPTPVDPVLSDRLVAQRDLDGHGVPYTQVVRVESEADTDALARLLTYAATVIRGDMAYQRELATWVGRVPTRLDTLPWGLIRSTTHLPDVPTLVRRLSNETTLLVLTADDARIDHLRAGLVTQHLWLSAVAAGLAASVHTQALQLPEVRAGLIEHLGLAGYPHLLMRLGYPAAVAPAPSRHLVEQMTEVG